MNIPLQNSTIAITHKHPAWELILQTEGLEYKTIKKEDTISKENFSVIITTHTPDKKLLGKLKNYLQTGGIILQDLTSKNSMTKIPPIRELSIYQLDNIDYLEFTEQNINQNYANSYDGGKLFTLPLRVDSLTNYESCIKTFSLNNFSISERVSLFPKHPILKLTSLFLKTVLPHSNVICKHLWYYPRGVDSIVSFRIDADEYDESDFLTTLEICKPYKEFVSWFFCTSSYNKPQPIQKTYKDGYDVQSHAHMHYIFNNSFSNEINLKKSKNFLKSLGIEHCGFCAPMGKYNPALQETMDKLGFLYSSEFSLAYDTLPFYPIHKDGFSKTLQIPIHPVCLELFAENNCISDKNFKDYFSAIIEYKIKNNLPLIFYAHPTKHLRENKHLLSWLLERLNNTPNTIKMNFTNFSKWWIQRNKALVDGTCTCEDLTWENYTPDKIFREKIRLAYPAITHKKDDYVRKLKNVAKELKNNVQLAKLSQTMVE